MVVRVNAKVTAAHPRQHMAGNRVLRQKTRLHARFFSAQLEHEAVIGQQGVQCFIGRCAFFLRGAVFGALAHQRQHQLVAGAPAIAAGPRLVGHVLQLAPLAGHGLVGIVLQARINGGANHQPVGIQVVAIGVRPADELLAQLHRKVRRRAHHLGLSLEVDAQRALFQGIELLLLQLAALEHLRQHGVAPRQCALGIEHRVVISRALEHADQRGAFQHIELVGRLVEIRARGHLDTKRVVEKRHGVEIGFKDLVLGVGRLDLQRRDRLLELARDGARAADFLGEKVARQLLRDGRAALRVAPQRQHHRRRRAPPVQPPVAVETVVFGGDERVHHVR